MVILHIPDNEYTPEKIETMKSAVNELINLSNERYSVKTKDTEYIFLHEYTSPNTFKEDVETAYLYQSIENSREETIKQSEAELRQLKEEIKGAIADDRVMIYLQPIFSNQQRRFISAEVLTRIKREDGSLLMPNIFIPAAEKTGVIRELEEKIIRKACEFIRDYDIKSIGMDYIEVNLSIKSGEKKDFAEKYKNIISEYDIDPSLINFEITETATLSEKRLLLENMNRLIEHGFKFSLDDFGSGESNLNYIIDMPITIIKFDKNLTDAYECNTKAEIVMKSTVQMAHDLGIKTISEGVETEEMFGKMKDIGIDFIQGYYFSRPLPIDEFVSFIRKHNIEGSL